MKRIALIIVKAVALCILGYIGLSVVLQMLNVFFMPTGTLGNENVDRARLLGELLGEWIGQLAGQAFVLWLIIWLLRKVLRIGRKAPTSNTSASRLQ